MASEQSTAPMRNKMLPYIFAGAFVLLCVGTYIGLPRMKIVSYNSANVSLSVTATSTPTGTPTTNKTNNAVSVSISSATATEIVRGTSEHVAAPPAVKAIYMSQCVVGTPSFRAKLANLVDTTELNSVIIDIKDYTGKIAFPTDDPLLKGSVSTACGASDMQAFIASLHAKGIYVIGRITTFQDPYYATLHPDQAVHLVSDHDAVWHDYKGLAFIDVSAKPYWDYIVSLSKDAYAIGFDELNYDYVRFPSDGPMKDAYYSWSIGMKKPEALEKFFAYLHKQVQPIGVVMSADLFGMVTTNTDDLNIGQQLERALPYFDYIDPMVYPSHYPKTFNGWDNPNAHPYDLIKYVMDAAVRRTTSTTSQIATLNSEPMYKTVTIPATTTAATTTKKVLDGYTKESYPATKIRPWLQDFSLGNPRYGTAEVKAQIQATYDAGLTSWLLWSAANTYTTGALEIE